MNEKIDYAAVEKDYMSGMKYREIADKYGVSINTVKSWKQRFKWKKKSVHENPQSVHTKKCAQLPKVDEGLIESLTEKERLFCEIYVRNFNATQAYLKAYGGMYNTANVEGPRLLVKPRVRNYIAQLKELKKAAIMMGEEDIVEKFMRIAFSDITDFVEFGRTIVPVMTAFGPMMIENPETGNKEVVQKEVNDVRFKESFEVDGGLISQVRIGKDGASLKLEDRQKALEWLANYFEMNPQDKHKKEYDNKRLAQEDERIELNKKKIKHGLNDEDVQKINDGIESLADLINNPVPNRKIDDE